MNTHPFSPLSFLLFWKVFLGYLSLLSKLQLFCTVGIFGLIICFSRRPRRYLPRYSLARPAEFRNLWTEEQREGFRRRGSDQSALGVELRPGWDTPGGGATSRGSHTLGRDTSWAGGITSRESHAWGRDYVQGKPHPGRGPVQGKAHPGAGPRPGRAASGGGTTSRDSHSWERDYDQGEPYTGRGHVQGKAHPGPTVSGSEIQGRSLGGCGVWLLDGDCVTVKLLTSGFWILSPALFEVGVLICLKVRFWRRLLGPRMTFPSALPGRFSRSAFSSLTVGPRGLSTTNSLRERAEAWGWGRARATWAPFAEVTGWNFWRWS